MVRSPEFCLYCRTKYKLPHHIVYPMQINNSVIWASIRSFSSDIVSSICVFFKRIYRHNSKAFFLLYGNLVVATKKGRMVRCQCWIFLAMLQKIDQLVPLHWEETPGLYGCVCVVNCASSSECMLLQAL